MICLETVTEMKFIYESPKRCVIFHFDFEVFSQFVCILIMECTVHIFVFIFAFLSFQ